MKLKKILKEELKRYNPYNSNRINIHSLNKQQLLQLKERHKEIIERSNLIIDEVNDRLREMNE